MRRKATLVHLDALPSVTPLVGGYLKACAEADPDIRAGWSIEIYANYFRTPASALLRHLVDAAPQVVGFSTYTWNAGIVRRVLPALRGLLRGGTQFLLGGVEVMHCGQQYVAAGWEDVAVCNGEGEHTFADFLRHYAEKRPPLEQVKGLSFYRDGEWITTEARPRIQDLDQLPSPWLTGAMNLAGIETALFETNRGCPFACEFCYWGGAIGQKIHRVGADRVKDELDYIVRQRIKALAVVDANFGILPRDREIAEHIAKLKRDHHRPTRIIFNSAKNNSERVEEVSRIFAREDLLVTQPISLQSVDAGALATAKRDNIKTDTYLGLQRRLNEWGVASMVELIWPLPGETLESFKRGIDDLCMAGAQAFAIYPLLWLNNVGYRQRTEELGVVTLREDDPASGAEVVIQTREVGHRDYIEGLRFATGLFLLHDCRGLYLTMQLLSVLGLARVREVVDGFARWIQTAPGGPVVDRWREGAEHFEHMHHYLWRGGLAHAVLHSDRRDFDRLLSSFVNERAEWLAGTSPATRDLLRAAFEFDLLSRPYVFFQTPLEVGVELEMLRVVERKRGLWTVESPCDFPALIRDLRTRGRLEVPARPEPCAITIDHRKGQVFRLPEKSEDEHHWHCHEIVREVGHVEARYHTRRLDGHSSIDPDPDPVAAETPSVERAKAE
jgi:hypothetical protein